MEKENILQTFISNKYESKIINEESTGENLQNNLLLKTPGLEIVDLEKYLQNPSSIKEVRSFDDLRGFVEYSKEFKGDDSVIFASRSLIEIIFDYHKKDSPKWGRHRAQYQIRPSSRWGIWLRAHNVWMNQGNFAEFLDTGLNEITNPTQSEILELVKDFRATVSQEVDSREGDGGTSFTYSKVTKGGSSKNSEIKMPDSLIVRLQPFDNLEVINSQLEENKKIPAYEFKVKINWRVAGEGDNQKIEFKVQILNIEQAVDKTLEILRSAIYDLTNVKTFIG